LAVRVAHRPYNLSGDVGFLEELGSKLALEKIVQQEEHMVFSYIIALAAAA
jgi:hypothetical protein